MDRETRLRAAIVGGEPKYPALKRILKMAVLQERFPMQTIGTQKARKRSFPRMNSGAPTKNLADRPLHEAGGQKGGELNYAARP